MATGELTRLPQQSRPEPLVARTKVKAGGAEWSGRAGSMAALGRLLASLLGGFAWAARGKEPRYRPLGSGL